MQKIITLFRRIYPFDGAAYVYDEVEPAAAWVQAGEGVATRKWDGTCCMIRGGKFFKWYSCREGKKLPLDFELAERKAFQDNKGRDVVKLYGWVPVVEGDPSSKWHVEAVSWNPLVRMEEGTYELIGPKVQGNAENQGLHRLVKHGIDQLLDAPRNFDSIREYLLCHEIEGIVWHHPDGRMVKIKARDFGIEWPR